MAHELSHASYAAHAHHALVQQQDAASDNGVCPSCQSFGQLGTALAASLATLAAAITRSSPHTHPSTHNLPRRRPRCAIADLRTWPDRHRCRPRLRIASGARALGLINFCGCTTHVISRFISGRLIVALACALPGAMPLAEAQVSDASSNPLQTVIVTAEHLNEERSHIQTQVGASTYTIDSAAIDAAPGGDNVLMNQVMLQVPDAAQDSFGQLHIRGDHNGLQFRLNGIILPDGISVFGQTLPPRLIESMQMIMGSLPAQYGLRSAGIIDLTTKSGALEPGGSVTLYGGSHGELEPSFNYGAATGPYTYFVTGDFLRNDLGIESPDGSSDPLHDHTKQHHGFAYAEDLLDEHDRLSAIIGLSDADFQIPNLRGKSLRWD